MRTEFRFRAGLLVPDGEGLRLSGVAVPYMSTGTNPQGRREIVLPGTFTDSLEDDGILLNVQHRRANALARNTGGMELIDGEKALEMRALLPNTTLARDTVEAVRTGVLRGLSVEMIVTRERTDDAGRREISKALLVGLAVVDDGTYPGTAVEARNVDEFINVPRRPRCFL